MLIGEKSNGEAVKYIRQRPDFGDAVRIELQLIETYLYNALLRFSIKRVDFHLNNFLHYKHSKALSIFRSLKPVSIHCEFFIRYPSKFLIEISHHPSFPKHTPYFTKVLVHPQESK